MSEKSNSGKWDKIAVFISIISLAISLGLTIHSFDLTAQANRLTERSLELQNILTNFTSVIVANPERGYLTDEFPYSNDTVFASYSHGYLNISLTVITPHYGTLSIEVQNFTVVDYYNMLTPEKVNLTTVTKTSEYDKYEDYVVTGLNKLSFSIELQARAYPNPQKLPTNGETQFPIGVLFLEAKLLDAQTNKISTRNEFSTVIYVTIKTL